MLIWGRIAGCDIVTRSAFSGKWKLVLRSLRLLVTNEREAPLQFSGEVGVFRGNMDRLPRFLTQPTVQFIGRTGDELTLAMYGHSFRSPSFDYRHRLSQEFRDLFPALQSFRLLPTLRLLAALLGFGHSHPI